MKERGINIGFGIILGLAIAGICLLVLILYWEKIYPLPYQTIQPTSPSSTVSTADLDELSRRVTLLEQNQTSNFQIFEWKLDQKLVILGWITLLISLATGVIGIKTYQDLDDIINEKVRKKLDNALYQLDPTNLSIFIPEMNNTIDKQEMKRVWNRLKLSGLENLSWYRGLESGHVKQLFEGVTVVLVKNDKDEEKFINFIKRHKKQLNPKRAAFIIYAKGKHQVEPSTFELYDNLATANMPATVASMVLVVARGLRELEKE